MSKLRLLCAMLIFALPLYAPTGTPAHADSVPCDQLVFDQEVRLGDGAAQVTEAAQALQNNGADVHVLLLSDIGNAANMDEYELSLEKVCPAWKVGDERKNNLVVVAFYPYTNGDGKPHGKIGIYYGGAWKRTMDSNYQRIELDMKDQFVSGASDKGVMTAGALTAGLTSGVTEINRLLDAQLHPSVTPAQPSGPTVVVDSQSTSLNGLWWVLGSIVALIALGALAFVLYRLFSDLRRDRMAKSEARQRAQLARSAVADQINALSANEADVIRKSYVTTYGEAAPELSRLWNDYRRAADDLAASYRALSSSHGDPDTPDLTVGQLERLAERYEALLSKASEVAQAAGQIDSLGVQLKRDLSNLPKDLADGRARLKSCAPDITSLVADGFRADDAAAKAARAGAMLDQAAAAGNTPSALALLHQAEQAIDEAVGASTAPRRRRDAISDRVSQLTNQAHGQRQDTQQASALAAELVQTYVESSVKPILGNDAEASKRLAFAEAAIAKAITLSSMETQDWDAADQQLALADKSLAKAASLIRSITALAEHLAEAKQRAAGEIHDAEADLLKAEQYLLDNSTDVDDTLSDKLRDAGGLLNQARSELAQPKPDYLLVVDLATQANAAADQIYATGVEEHETAVRLRKQVTAANKAAAASVSTAKEYLSDHTRDVGDSAKRSLKNAKSLLASADTERDPATRLSLLKKAKTHADQALSSAQSDFDDAEAARRPTYTDSTVLVGGYTSSHDDDHGSFGSWGSSSSHHDSGGGGSFDFGSSSDSGGGGSFDFGGGGGDGGGGSTDF